MAISSSQRAEAHEHVQAHRDEALEPVGHRRHLDAKELLAEHRLERAGRLERDLPLGAEHRAVDAEVVVVRAVELIEADVAGVRGVAVVGGDRRVVVGHYAGVVAAEHVDVCRHVQQVPGVGDQRAQHVGRAQRLFGVGGHLHQVDVEVQQAGVGHTAGEVERPLEHSLDLQCARARRRLAGRDVPQLPGGEVHHRVGVERGDVEVVGVARVDAGHRVGVGELARREVLDRLGPREPLRQRVDQVALDVGRARCGLARGGDGSVRTAQRRVQVDGVEGVPVLVVVRAGGVGDAPVGERAAGIVLPRPARSSAPPPRG